MTLNQDLSEIESIEIAIRSGLGAEVHPRLKALLGLSAKRRRQWSDALPRVCGMLRRAGMPEVALKLLRKGGRRDEIKNLSAEELLEYCLSLAHVGGQEEALRHVTRLAQDPHAPQERVRFYRARILQNQWDYRAAQDLLESLSPHSRELDEYDRLVARVNLSACYVQNEELEKGLALTKELIEATRRKNYHLLHGNVLGHAVQLALLNRNLAAAQNHGADARALLKGVTTFDRFAVERAFLLANPRPNLDELKRLSNEASALGLVETARECDFHFARLCKDESQLYKLWLGTPFASFRARIRALEGVGPFLVPGSYFLNSIHSHPPAAQFLRFDPRVTFEAVVRQPLLVKLLEALSVDFYRAQKPAALFSKLFPEEFYHPFSSPNRLHQLVRRARSTLLASNACIEIIWKTDGWVLAPRARRSGRPIQVTCHRAHDGSWVPLDHGSERERLLRLFSAQTPIFGRPELERALGVKSSTANFLLQQAVKAGWLQMTGAGRSTRYSACLPSTP